MSAQTDLELVQSFQQGNEGAFNQIVLRYQERLYWVARRFVNDHDQADDVVQDVLIKAYQGLGGFRADSEVFTWLYRITVNTAINQLRKARVREFLQLDDLLNTEPASDPAPDESLEQDEQRQLINEAVKRLPAKQKAVFLLRYYDELPYEQIAEILHTSVGGLKANYFHAVKKVADYVKRAHETH